MLRQTFVLNTPVKARILVVQTYMIESKRSTDVRFHPFWFDERLSWAHWHLAEPIFHSAAIKVGQLSEICDELDRKAAALWLLVPSMQCFHQPATHNALPP